MRDSQVLLDPEVHAVDKWVVASALEASGLDLLHDSQIIIIFAARDWRQEKTRAWFGDEGGQNEILSLFKSSPGGLLSFSPKRLVFYLVV